MPRTQLVKRKAWLTNTRDIAQLIDPRYEPYIYIGTGDTPEGWVEIGEVDILVTFLDSDILLSSTLQKMEEAKKRVMADAQAKVTALDSEIQKLLALTWESK